jgi:hypothetical protein
MVVPPITQTGSPNFPFIEYRDLTFQNTGLVITSTAYITANDRIYDVRTGADIGFLAQLEFVSGGSILFEIESTPVAQADYSNFGDWQTLQVETALASGFSNALEIVRATPLHAAIRLRMKLASAGTATIKGTVGWF